MVDDTQMHMLGVVRMIMRNYNLSSETLSWYLEHVENLDTTVISSSYDDYLKAKEEYNKLNSGPTYVTTRREFCSVMSKGIKICPRYSSCDDENCKNFHIKEQYICQHVTRGSYCDRPDCDLIVIRPCRKGKRCNDPDCSFKH